MGTVSKFQVAEDTVVIPDQQGDLLSRIADSRNLPVVKVKVTGITIRYWDPENSPRDYAGDAEASTSRKRGARARQ